MEEKPCDKVLHWAQNRHLSGVCWLDGIPGHIRKGLGLPSCTLATLSGQPQGQQCGYWVVSMQAISTLPTGPGSLVDIQEYLLI